MYRIRILKVDCLIFFFWIYGIQNLSGMKEIGAYFKIALLAKILF